MTVPNFLLPKPEPAVEQRLYNGRKLPVWKGKVAISVIEGWIDNPRIALAIKDIHKKVGDRDLTQEEVFELMKNDNEVKLKELRDDILKNGLREPLTLSFNKKLLDGNRRFFALKFALEGLPQTHPDRQDLETVSVYVLMEDALKEDEENVLVEENFSASHKIEWPDYIKASMIIKADESGMDVDDIARKFNWTKSKVKETLKIHGIINDYIVYATAARDANDEYGGGLGMTEYVAENEAAKNYQFFNEAQKSFFDHLQKDIDFKIQFFKWIHEDKFKSFPEVRMSHDAWINPEARAALLQPDPTAAKSAKAILDYNSRIVKSKDETIGRIESFANFLKNLPAEQIAMIPTSSIEHLREALTLVVKLGDAAKN